MRDNRLAQSLAKLTEQSDVERDIAIQGTETMCMIETPRPVTRQGWSSCSESDFSRFTLAEEHVPPTFRRATIGVCAVGLAKLTCKSFGHCGHIHDTTSLVIKSACVLARASICDTTSICTLASDTLKIWGKVKMLSTPAPSWCAVVWPTTERMANAAFWE